MEKRYEIKNSRAYLGFIPIPSHVSIKRANTHHIEANVDHKRRNLTLSTRQFVFDRIRESSIQVSIFDKIRQQKETPIKKAPSSTHSRLGPKLSKNKVDQIKIQNLALKDFNEPKSKVPSHMKRCTILV